MSPSGAPRLRMAPSPTGFMHVGTARTALFNWLFARQTGGRFVLRIEDTDRARLVPGAVEDLMEGLRWLGIEPDEGPGLGGDHGPYVQSERLPLYREQAERLLAMGEAYRCFCSPERLQAVREARLAAGQKLGYDRHCRGLDPARSAERASAGEPHVLRLAMPLAGTITLRDLLRGSIDFDVAEMEDVVLIKSDGFPTYHFAVVVDDHAMAISHVLRGDEWIPSAPIQVRLYTAFGWPEPAWVHLPLVLNPDGKGKLSKRHRTVLIDGEAVELMTMVSEYRRAGYLPEAMFNFLALLGWSFSGEEDLFTREEAIERFRIEDIKPSPATWNLARLRWMNGVYLRALAPEDLADRLLPFLQEAGLPADLETTRALVPLLQPRMVTLADAAPLVGFIWAERVAPDPAELVPKGLTAADTAALLADAESRLAALESWDPEAIEAALRALAELRGLKAGPAFQPVRVAVTGQKVAPPLFETLEVLGRARCLERLGAARALLLAEAQAAG